MASAALSEVRTKRGAVLRLMRPHQWVKNALVLAALVFAKRMFIARDVALGLLAFAAFCALSSTTYVVNDILDREADRLNPEKRDRPIARGDISVEQGRTIALALGIVAAAISVVIGRQFVGIAILYWGLQLTYSLWAKRVMVVDIIAVAIGF